MKVRSQSALDQSLTFARQRLHRALVVVRRTGLTLCQLPVLIYTYRKELKEVRRCSLSTRPSGFSGQSRWTKLLGKHFFPQSSRRWTSPTFWDESAFRRHKLQNLEAISLGVEPLKPTIWNLFDVA